MAHRNFARGSAPPAHSYEWAGVEKPPGTIVSPTSRRPVGVVVTERVTIVATMKKKRWPFYLGAGVLAGGIGYFFGKKAR